jgi:hypothetical protein
MPDSVKQIAALVHRYCELFDTGQFDEFAAQFEHGQWHRADPDAAAARRWRWTRREVIGDLYGDVSHHVRHHPGPADRQEIAVSGRWTSALSFPPR